VSPYTPPAPDPCQALKNAYNRAAQRVSDIEDALRRLREQFAQASYNERAAIRQEIEEATAEKEVALQAAEAALAAYKQCRAQNEIRTKEFTF
jgi:predicted enzyme involved in methoxymalonyl-ACP biosynthesis